MTTTTTPLKIRIAIDVDEVLAQFLPKCNEWYNRKFKTQFKVEDYSSYNYQQTWLCSNSEATDRVFDFLDSPDFDEIEPVAGSQLALSRLALSFDLCIVTSRQNFLETRTNLWLKTHYPNIHFSSVLFGNQWRRPGCNSSRFSKRELCASVGARALVDDLPQYIIDAAPVLDKAILFDHLGRQNWSKIDPAKLGTLSNIKVAHTWNEVCAILLETQFRPPSSSSLCRPTQEEEKGGQEQLEEEEEQQQPTKIVVEPVRT